MSPIVVVADHYRTRCEAIKRLLGSEYDVDLLPCGGWDALQHEQAEATINRIAWKVVVVSYDLPGILAGEFRSSLEAIFRMQPVQLAKGHVVVLHHPSRPAINIDPHTPHWIPSESLSFDEQKARDVLEPLLRPTPLPMVRWEIEDLILSQQLAWLNPQGRSDGEMKVLQQLLQKFRKGCQSATIYRMTPGYSGSLVFRVQLCVEREKNETVLMKISRQDDLWKIRRTFDNWVDIERSLNAGGLQRAAPKLLKPDQPDEQFCYLASTAGFYAEFWQYLNGPVGRFADWEEVHWRADNNLPSSEKVLADVLELLRAAWYDDAVWTETRPLWTTESISQPAAIAFPPYGLTTWWKAKVLSSLAELERLGQRLCKDAWQADCDTIRNWLTGELPVNSVATTEERVMLSAIHGDLNKNNVLWWCEKKRPLLIDFATYQSAAHTLQDYANLETQVKYALMDREYESRVRALDYSDEQLGVWCDRLPAMVPDPPSTLRTLQNLKTRRKKCNGITQAESLIGFIRQEAQKVFDTAVERSVHTALPDRFCDEYAAALLYHTIRMIGYDNSLSPFKRLLAVQDSARLIARLKKRADSCEFS